MQNTRRDGFIVKMKIKDDRGMVVDEIDAVTYKGLLSLAHDEGVRLVRTKLLQVPDDGNGKTAIVHATVVTRKGSFMGLGDASPQNVNRRIAPHVIRMAETRAIARALRFAVNIGEVSIEELGVDDTIEAASSTRAAPSRPSADRPPVARQPTPANDTAPTPSAPERMRGRDDHPTEALPSDRRAMSEEQKKFLFRLAYGLGCTRENALPKVLGALGVERLEHATRVDASRAIDALKAERDEREAIRAGSNGANGEARP